MREVVYPSERYTIDEPPSLWDEVDDLARALYTTRDAAAMLNVGQNTLRDWALKAGIQRIKDPSYDARVQGWTIGELQHIADLHHRKLGKPPVEPEPSRRMRELTARVATLEAEVAELKSRAAGVLPSRSRSADQQAPANAEGAYPPVARPKRTTVQLVQSRNDTLPPGWMAVERWVRTHPPLKLRTVQRHIDVGLVPEPQHGNWKQGRVSGIKHVWDEEQQAAALRFYQERGDIPVEHINT